MNVIVKNIDKTSLGEKALVKVVKKFFKLKKDIFISFDSRLTGAMGSHIYCKEKKRHIIKISILNTKMDNDKILSDTAEKYNILTVLLHELKHAEQFEKFNKKYWTNDINKDIKEKELAIEYSKLESEARAYENSHILKAVEFYDQCILKKERKRK